ncbi:MAG: PAS-domain containing protein [Rhodobiaceae bacterium]|nr:PAS-domain containing protein [Rhodobiaceae bacterium]MCC0055263.1 PAS-domain containing protein [Rhodobiaceae bacterium]
MTGAGAALAASPALAQATPETVFDQMLPAGVENYFVLAIIAGVVSFAVVVAIHWSRTQAQLSGLKQENEAAFARMQAERDAAFALLMAGYPIVIRWGPDAQDPAIDCAAPAGSPLPADRADVLAFGRWLAPAAAAELEHAIGLLRSAGTSFSLALATRHGAPIQADGMASGAMQVVRFRDSGESERAYAQLYENYRLLKRDAEALQTVLAAVAMPAWLRDGEGRLSWVNEAYAAATGNGSAANAVEKDASIFGNDADREIAAALETAGHYRAHMTLPGSGRHFALETCRVAGIEAGIALDVTEDSKALRSLSQEIDGHLHTLNKLGTGVARFDDRLRLQFANTAVRRLWQLDPEWLDASPHGGDILDALRSARRIPDEADYRGWKERFLTIPEKTRDELWRLPDGQKLRVVADPQPQGGIAYLFEDVTERMALQSRFEQVSELQRETLDNLSEAIVVFASNGRLRLSNPAMHEMWSLDESAMASAPRIDQVIAWCRDRHGENDDWAALHAAVTGLEDRRQGLERRFRRADGRVIHMSAAPLPDGGTLAVFIDVTDAANVEETLRQANEALTAAAKLRNDFLQKISYELRVPLTTIIGYAQILAGTPGAPESRRSEQTGHILTSANALLTMIDDILDLATVDAGAMTIDIADIDISRIIDSACEGLRDRLEAKSIVLSVDIEDDIGPLKGDAARLKQVLFNILSNAIGFSDDGGRIEIGCAGDATAVTVTVRDYGAGIAQEQLGRVFDRFESHTAGTAHRGAGLGLAIVRSFVALHGGNVQIESRKAEGTSVVVRLPRMPKPPEVKQIPPAAPRTAASEEAARARRTS